MLLLTSSVLLIQSCKKSFESTNNTNSPIHHLHNKSSQVNSEDIMMWLKKEKTIDASNRNVIIQKIIDNAEWNNIYSEVLNDKEFIVNLPLNRNFSNHDALIGDDPTFQFLSLIEDENGQIRAADLLFVYPSDPNIDSLPENSFHDLFIQQTFPVDGKVSLYNLDNIKQFESEFTYEKQTKFSLWQGRLAPPPGGGGLGEVCIDWYLTTTIFDEFGNAIDYSETFLYTSCNTGGSGGFYNPINQEGEYRTGIHTWLAYRITWSDGENRVYGNYFYCGLRFRNNPSRNVFYCFSAYGPSIRSNIGVAASPSSNFYSTWVGTSSGNLTSDITAHTNIQGQLYFPNTGMYRVISENYNWTAAYLLR